MKKYVVSLLGSLFFLALQPLHAVAGHSARVGFTSRSFVVGAGPRHFASPSIHHHKSSSRPLCSRQSLRPRGHHLAASSLCGEHSNR